MFFYLSKILWFFANPANLLLMALCLGAVLVYRRRDRWGRRLLALSAVMAVVVTFVPVGANMILVLENRFPVVEKPPETVDGIIVLGGVVNELVTKARGQVSIGGAVERLTEFASLSKRYPSAKLIFTGGSGKLLSQDVKEGDAVDPLLEALGVDRDRVMIDNRSRNTHENAQYSMELGDPLPGETWLLVTSAFHMPRSMGVFRKAGWDVLAYPVDFNLQGKTIYLAEFSFITGLVQLTAATHEWLGLAFYRLTGRTDALFPGP